jgi:hypothetical protein
LTLAAILWLTLAAIGCANYRATYTAYHDQCVSQWGPEGSWTPSQNLSYLQGSKSIRDQQLGETRPIHNNPAPNQGGYTAWGSDGQITTITPDNRGGYTAWGSDGHTTTITPDNQGGYTAWGSDGQMTTITPDH